MNKTPTSVIGIVVVTIVIFLISNANDSLQEATYKSLGLFFPLNPNFRYWQIVTTIFMHGGFVHLAFNMYALWAFGTPLALIWGNLRFLFFYFASGIGASIIYTGVNYFQFKTVYDGLIASGVSNETMAAALRTGSVNDLAHHGFSAEQLVDFMNTFHIPAVGASGAIYGILVAFGMLFPNAKLALIFFPVPIAAKYFIPVLIALDLFSGVTGFSIFGGGIAHFAHVGGAIIGFLLMLYWKRGKGDASLIT